MKYGFLMVAAGAALLAASVKNLWDIMVWQAAFASIATGITTLFLISAKKQAERVWAEEKGRLPFKNKAA